MDRDAVLAWLRTDDPARLEALWAEADRVRAETVGDAVHLRGLIEISNRCDRRCLYCGLRAPNREIARYALSADEILDRAREANRRGYGTVVLQAGEDLGMSAAWLAEVVRDLKAETGLAVTLSVGERPDADYALWREAGADRYLLRFETSDADLMRRLHPPREADPPERPALLRTLRGLGYEIGGGVMVGLPGQTRASLADDVALFAALDLDMIGIGCWVPHPGTPLAREAGGDAPDQAPATALETLKMVALARLACPEANIPSSTALATVAGDGHAAGLRCGANVIMPNLTPGRYRRLYDIYPTGLRDEDAGEGERALAAIRDCGRRVGRGRGDRVSRERR